MSLHGIQGVNIPGSSSKDQNVLVWQNRTKSANIYVYAYVAMALAKVQTPSCLKCVKGVLRHNTWIPRKHTDMKEHCEGRMSSQRRQKVIPSFKNTLLTVFTAILSAVESLGVPCVL